MGNARNPLVWLGAALVVAIALMAVLGVVSFASYGGGYGMMGNGAELWGLVMMAVPAGILIAILVMVVGGLREPAGARPGSPLEVLELRYARGELGREEYLRARDDLARGVPRT